MDIFWKHTMTLGDTVFANCLLIDILSGNSFFLRYHITKIKPMNARDFAEKVRAIVAILFN